jgi:hypothetical protein
MAELIRVMAGYPQACLSQNRGAGWVSRETPPGEHVRIARRERKQKTTMKARELNRGRSGRPVREIA